jgi:hypothetical protein
MRTTRFQKMSPLVRQLYSRSLLVFFVPVLLTGTAAGAQTDVWGDVVSDTAWTAAGSPYLLQQDVAIVVGVTLIVEPGVSISTTFDIGGAGSDTVAVEVANLGTLKLDGTQESVISIGPTTTSEPNPIVLSYLGSILDASGVALTGDLRLLTGSKYVAEPTNGISVNGAISLAASLVVASSSSTVPGETYILIDNLTSSPVLGTFAGLTEGATFEMAGIAWTVTYEGGDGNDVALTRSLSSPCTSGPDSDTDGFCDDTDNCPETPNPDQADVDGDGIGDACDNDSDNDGWPDDEDTCPGGDDNVDTDGDGVPDFCDLCPFDSANDSDGDGVCDSDDQCVGNDDTGDFDGDGVCDDIDGCLGNDAGGDSDGDGICDDIDGCLGDDAAGDSDVDGICDDLDQCSGSDASGDTDGDLTCNDLDVCPDDLENDADGDGICESEDTCPSEWNPNQSDNDEDMIGDECDFDDDNDTVPDVGDNCPLVANPGQEDVDGDGLGDVCDDTDEDGDGVGDAGDTCPQTAIGAVVAANGCSIAQLCPCDHSLDGDSWKNHGAYVSCVARVSEVFLQDSLISFEEKEGIVSEAAESSCGHKNR